MHHIRSIIILICVFMVQAAPALAVDLGLRGYYWLPGLEGDVKVDGSNISGTKLDFQSDLGIDEESYPVLEAFAGIGKHHLSVSYYKSDYEGNKVLKEEVAFNGAIYAVDEAVKSKLSYAVYDFEYRYDLLDLENLLAGGSVGLVGKVKYVDGLVSIENQTAGKEEQDFRAPIPMIGAHAHIGLLADLLEFRAQLAGIGYSGAALYEGFADVSLTPYPFVDIHAGYRALVLDVDVDDIEINFNTTGPYLGISVGF